ncbi:ferritin-like domain-containing protein [Haloferax namakaokahaiae]|uniref:Ferritin-like domain-containing protein n=1 Tax=Haloferax namakaokahaiae TaxID=1748331 RepID=A0ABD5ZDE0_9EURY
MTTESMKSLLVEGLQELYYAEQELDEALQTLAEETEDKMVSNAFADHRKETQEQIDRLERVFEHIDEEPKTREDHVVDAMISEHREFARENSGEVLDRFNMATGQKTEHYEIAAYGNLTSLAGKLGYDEAADLLEETLREEEQALETVSRGSEQFDQQEVAGD